MKIPKESRSACDSCEIEFCAAISNNGLYAINFSTWKHIINFCNLHRKLRKPKAKWNWLWNECTLLQSIGILELFYCTSHVSLPLTKSYVAGKSIHATLHLSSNYVKKQHTLLFELIQFFKCWLTYNLNRFCSWIICGNMRMRMWIGDKIYNRLEYHL